MKAEHRSVTVSQKQRSRAYRTLHSYCNVFLLENKRKVARCGCIERLRKFSGHRADIAVLESFAGVKSMLSLRRPTRTSRLRAPGWHQRFIPDFPTAPLCLFALAVIPHLGD